MKEKVLIVGSVAYDTVETAAGRVECALGGAASYAAAAAGFYCLPCLVAVVGEDFEKEHLDYFAGCGIDLCGLSRVPGRTFRWSGRYLPDMIGRETLSTELNVFEDFDPELPEQLRAIPYLFLANIHPRLQGRVLEQMRPPRLTVLDTMNLWIETARDELMELLPRVDLLTLNDEEARMLTGKFNLYQAARWLMDRGVKLGVVVKRGEHGSTLVTREGMGIAAAYPVEELIDPTGAGDSFAGAMIGALAEAGDLSLPTLRRAIMHGAALASFTVEGFSLDRLRGLTRRDIDDRVRAFRDLLIVE